jgi:hypothetical protein
MRCSIGRFRITAMKKFLSLFLHFLIILALSSSAVVFADPYTAEQKVYDEELRLQQWTEDGKIYDQYYNLLK